VANFQLRDSAWANSKQHAMRSWKTVQLATSRDKASSVYYYAKKNTVDQNQSGSHPGRSQHSWCNSVSSRKMDWPAKKKKQFVFRG
jgi:hypothetical protein